MPRRLAITAPHKVEVLEYQDKPLEPHQVRVKTELASGKHGTTLAGFDGLNFQGQRFDSEMRLFVEAESKTEASNAPQGTGTTGVGTITEIGSKVTRWKVGSQVFGFMDVRETNACHEERLWELGELHPHLALCVEPAYVAFHCIRESQVRFGDSVAIIGLGGGTVCAAGFYQGEAHGLWLGRGWHQNRLTMIVPHGCGWGHLPRDYPRWDGKRAYDCIVHMMRQGKLTADGLIDPVVSLEQGPEVFRLIEHEPDKVIKFAIRF